MAKSWPKVSEDAPSDTPSPLPVKVTFQDVLKAAKTLKLFA